MSKATKRKHVTKEVLDDFILPDEAKYVVQVLASRGNNLHEVLKPSGEKFLASMPTKFRKNVWIKRGDYVLVESIDEGDKVKAEIAHILYREQRKYIKDEGLWPKEFDVLGSNKEEGQIPSDMLPPSDESDNSDEDRDDIETVCNPNRQAVTYSASSSSEEDDT